MADHPEGKFLGEPPLDESTVSDPGRAVFLSYTSQDAQAAQKICEALSAGGIEVSSIRANCGAGMRGISRSSTRSTTAPYSCRSSPNTPGRGFISDSSGNSRSIARI